MREAGLESVSRRKKVRTTVSDKSVHPAPDLVERNFIALAPDRLWVSDITYVPTRAGFLYLAVVVDAFSRRVVGWAMSTSLKTQIVNSSRRHSRIDYLSPLKYERRYALTPTHPKPELSTKAG
jgi:transposase InsO family protein